jgi:metallo-beta-lactamase family protein
VAYGERVQIHPRIHLRFRDAGHIIGSSSVELWIEDNGREVKLLFSGDIGSRDQAIIRNPEPIDYADILFIESTYGDRLHKNRVDTYEEFKEIINDSYNKKGNIIIPSFAVGRTQEIIYTLGKLMRDEEIPSIPVYIDSPLAISATEIFRNNPECFDRETLEILSSGDSPLDFPTLSFSRTAEESKRLCREAQGSIIISASGMCTAGRIKYHLMNNLYRKDSAIVFVGYQARGTLGRRIIDGAQQVRVYGEDVRVNARIETLGGFSAHADREGLVNWMSSIDNPDLQVFVVHGEDEAAVAFADTIQERFNYATHIPVWGEIIDVDTMRSDMAGYGKEEGPDMVEHEIESLSRTLELLTSRYREARKENKIQDTRSLQEDIYDTRELLAMLIDEL